MFVETQNQEGPGVKHPYFKKGFSTQLVTSTEPLGLSWIGYSTLPWRLFGARIFREVTLEFKKMPWRFLVSKRTKSHPSPTTTLFRNSKNPPNPKLAGPWPFFRIFEVSFRFL